MQSLNSAEVLKLEAHMVEHSVASHRPSPLGFPDLILGIATQLNGVDTESSGLEAQSGRAGSGEASQRELTIAVQQNGMPSSNGGHVISWSY